jgi:hypothetical protein
VDVASIPHIPLRNEEPHIDAPRHLLAEILVGSIVVSDALWLTALPVLVAVESCLEKKVEGLQDSHDGQHLPAGQTVKKDRKDEYTLLYCDDMMGSLQ